MRRLAILLAVLVGVGLGWYTSGSVSAQPGYGWPGLAADYTWTGTHDFTGATISLDTVTWTGTQDFSGATLTVPSSFTSGSDTVDFATGQAEDEVLTYNASTNVWASEPVTSVTIGTLNALAKFAAADLADSDLANAGVPAAGASGNVVTFDATFNAMDNSDTVNAFHFDMTNYDSADHTGAGNTFSVINIEGITNDAQATENAINIGDGFNYAITIPDGGAADNSISLGDTPGSDADIYFNTVDLIFDMDGTATNGVKVQLGVGSAAQFIVENLTATTKFLVTPTNTTNAGFSFVEILIPAIYATNGSDIVNMLNLDWNETDWATSTETLNAINIDTITQDAQGTYNILNLGNTWDYFINDLTDTALGSHGWTTNADKDANTASGTIRVYINGTLYHIQLYADS